MPKFSANLAYLFSEVPYFDRFELAAEAGFEAVDVPDPYGPAARDTQRALLKQGLSLLSICGPPPNHTGGAPGLASVPGSESRFRMDMKRVNRYAKALNARFVCFKIGAGTEDTLIENLTWAADFDRHRTLLVKTDPKNEIFGDIPKLAATVSSVDRPNVKLLFDVTDEMETHSGIHRIWDDIGSVVAHVSFAKTPVRGNTKAITPQMKDLFSLLDQSGYDGWVSAAYVPGNGNTSQTLRWMR